MKMIGSVATKSVGLDLACREQSENRNWMSLNSNLKEKKSEIVNGFWFKIKRAWPEVPYGTTQYPPEMA